MMQKGIKLTLIISGILVLADIVSTLINWELVEHLEANPLISYGGLPFIIFVFIMNAVFLYFAYKIYNKTKNVDTRFIVMFVMTLVILTRLTVIVSNIQIFLNPPPMELVLSVTQAMKNQAMRQTVFINLMPYFAGVITWYLFRRDHNVNIIGNNP